MSEYVLLGKHVHLAECQTCGAIIAVSIEAIRGHRRWHERVNPEAGVIYLDPASRN